jgi:hypothetical protein
MYSSELPYFIPLSLLLLASPFLPASLFLFLDHLVVRALFILSLLYLISIGPTVGIFGLVVIAVLFMERNRVKVRGALQKWDALDATKKPLATVEEASTPQKTVPVAPFSSPSSSETEFLPQSSCENEPLDISVFEPVAPSLNEKVVLASAYPLAHHSAHSTASSESMYEQLGFGHVRGVETVS